MYQILSVTVHCLAFFSCFLEVCCFHCPCSDCVPIEIIGNSTMQLGSDAYDAYSSSDHLPSATLLSNTKFAISRGKAINIHKLCPTAPVCIIHPIFYHVGNFWTFQDSSFFYYNSSCPQVLAAQLNCHVPCLLIEAPSFGHRRGQVARAVAERLRTRTTQVRAPIQKGELKL